MLQDLTETDHPGCELDVDVRELLSEKKRALGVGYVDDFCDLSVQLLGVFGLLGKVLGLEELVECGDDVPVDLWVLVDAETEGMDSRDRSRVYRWLAVEDYLEEEVVGHRDPPTIDLVSMTSMI